MPAADTRQATSSVGERYRVLLDVGRTLAATLSTQDLYAAIHRETARVISASGFYISTYDHGRDLATIVYLADKKDVRPANMTYRGSASAVISSRKAVLVKDRLAGRSPSQEDEEHPAEGKEEARVTRSAISAPMIHKGKLIGSLSAQSYRPAAYSEEDLALLQGIADISAVAIDNAHHVDELERRRVEAEQIEEIGRALTSSLEARDVMGKVISAVTDVLNVDGAAVWMCDDPMGMVARLAASGGDVILPEGLVWDMSGVLGDQLLDEKKPVILDDLATSPLVPENLQEHLTKGSGIAAPLVLGGVAAGILAAGSRKVRHFVPDDTEVLQRLASQAAVAMENARLHANVKALSLTDPLTGIPNRRRLQIHLDKEVAAARRGRPLVLVVFDIDDFKRCNDTLGHLAGDDILRAFAEILDVQNRAMNLVVRYGGDEFVSILSDTDAAGADLYVTRVRDRVSADAVMSPLGITVSVGVAVFDPVTMRTVDDLIHAADADMYRAKEARRQAGITTF
jgi:diguanylate cyclase (GGDEF)-like protein